MVADAGDEFEFIGEFDDVVVSAECEGLGFDIGFFAGGEDDHGDVFSGGVSAEEFDHSEAIDIGHDEVLEDDGGFDLGGDLEGLGGVIAIMELNIGFILDHLFDGFGDHGLVIDEEDGNFIGGGFEFCFCGFASGEAWAGNGLFHRGEGNIKILRSQMDGRVFFKPELGIRRNKLVLHFFLISNSG